MQASHWILMATAGLLGHSAWAQGSAQQVRVRVLESVPVIETIAIPQQHCYSTGTLSTSQASTGFIDAAPSGTPPAQLCRQSTAYEHHTVGYDVSYDYGGQRHTTRLDHAPGPWLQLSIPAQGSYSSSSSSPGTVYATPGVSYQSAPAGSASTTNSLIYTPPPLPAGVQVDIRGYLPPLAFPPGRPELPPAPPHGMQPPPTGLMPTVPPLTPPPHRR